MRMIDIFKNVRLEKRERKREKELQFIIHYATLRHKNALRNIDYRAFHYTTIILKLKPDAHVTTEHQI